MTDCGCPGSGDAGAGLPVVDRAVPAPGKLVFERQGEMARELLCCMFKTGMMSDVEVVIDDTSSIRAHTEVLVRVSGYFRTVLQGS